MGDDSNPIAEQTPISEQTPIAGRTPIADSIAALDRQLLQMAQQRCQLLSQWQADRNGPQFPSALQNMEASRRELADAYGLESDLRTREFQRQLITYVAGASYAQVVQSALIAYLGPEQSYSYLAAVKFFGAASNLQSVPSIAAVFEEIARDHARYGVVPIENSTDGRIVDTFTMFIRTPVQICGEILLPIQHNLLARCNRSEIRTVYSKPQALSQCRGWLAQHLPDVRCVEATSTTAAAKIAASEPGAAAVASIEAAIDNGLEVIARSIEDNPHNATRFVVIGKDTPSASGHDKTSLMFQVPHKPGALADVMVLFKNSGINLTWIESFPAPGQPNEYYFFVELEGHREQPQVAKAIETLRRDALRLEWLGSYPRAAPSELRQEV